MGLPGQSGPVGLSIKQFGRDVGIGRDVPVRSLHLVGGVALRPASAQSGSQTASLTALGGCSPTGGGRWHAADVKEMRRDGKE